MTAFERAELEVVRLARQHGWPASRILDQARDGGSDIAGIPGVCLEVKRHETASPWAWWAQVTAAAKPGEIPVVAFRRSQSEWLAICQLEALAPDDLATIVETHIRSAIDPDVLDRVVAAERADRAELLGLPAGSES